MRLLLCKLLGGATCMLGLAACDWTDTSVVEEQVVVEAYLVAGEPLPALRLTRSTSVDATYAPETAAVAGAQVLIERLSSEGAPSATYPYRASAAEPSIYVPEISDAVEPRARYALRVTLPSGELVTAETTVPDTLNILSVSGDSVRFREEPIELTLTPSFYPGRVSFFVLSAEALDASLENATPLTERILRRQEDELTVEDLRMTSSPPISEETYAGAPGEPLLISVPWLAVRFYGAHRVRVSAIDDNLYDFLRSQLVQQGGSTFLPGEVPNILDRVSGGTGVFGSYASTSRLIFVRKPPD